MVKSTNLIEIVINNKKDLYENFSFNLEGKLLNKELEDYIFNHIKEFPLKKEVILSVHLFGDFGKADEELIRDSIHSHYCFRERESSLSLKHKLKEWRVNMMLGIVFIVFCFILVQICESINHIRYINILKESLLIVGWVALWEPITFILFDWRIARKDKSYHKKLCSIPVKIVEHNGK
jgi:hypothetical protein